MPASFGSAPDGSALNASEASGGAGARRGLQSEESDTSSSTSQECSGTPVLFPPQEHYHVVLTSREALQDLGVHFIDTSGKTVFPVFDNRLAVPSLSEGLDAKEIRNQEEQLKSKGAVLPLAKYFALQGFGNRKTPVACGACKGKFAVFLPDCEPCATTLDRVLNTRGGG